jgi:hypothetical protein
MLLCCPARPHFTCWCNMMLAPLPSPPHHRTRARAPRPSRCLALPVAAPTSLPSILRQRCLLALPTAAACCHHVPVLALCL